MMRYLCCHCTFNAAEFAGGKDLLSTKLCDAGCPEVGPFVQPTEGTKGPRNGAWDGTCWLPGNAKLTPALPQRLTSRLELRPWTGDLRPGEQWTRLPMNVFPNEGFEGRWPRHATIPIPINPSRTQAVEAQAANDSIPLSASWVLFRSAMAILPGQGGPLGRTDPAESHPHIAGMEAACRMPSLEYHHFKVNTSPPGHTRR